MRIKRLAALSLATVVTAGMLTGCDWLAWLTEHAASSSSSSSSSSSTSRPSYDGGDDDNDDDDGGDDSSSASSDPVKQDAVITTTSDGGTLYTVYTNAGFMQWAKAANEAAATDPGIDCTLEGDIDLTGTLWTSIGGTYTGNFDGQGHSISGLNGGCGLFASIGEKGTVKNVKLVDVNFSGYYAQCGGVAATNLGTISGCTVSGTITATVCAGGIAGRNDGGTIQGCFFSGTVTSTEGSSRVGGIAGANSTGSITGGSITGCCVAGGTVTATGNDSRAGGIAGTNDTGSITGCCFAGGTVTATGGYSYAGGIAGANYGGITNCYWRKGPEGPDKAVGNSSEEATELTTGNLNDAIKALNDALAGTDVGYRYDEENGNPILVANTAANLLAQYFGLTLPL